MIDPWNDPQIRAAERALARERAADDAEDAAWCRRVERELERDLNEATATSYAELNELLSHWGGRLGSVPHRAAAPGDAVFVEGFGYVRFNRATNRLEKI
jgi:hypothetical protein